MRKDYLSKVVVKISAMARETFGVTISHKRTDEVLGFALALGYVSGKRGRDGGYLVTDAGLEFIGEDVASFRAEEARIEAAKEQANKESRKQANKARKQALANELANAMDAA